MENGLVGKGIYSALIAANRSIGAIGKDRKNKEQGFNFRGIDDVMNALHAALADVGVVILTAPEGAAAITERKTRNGGTIFHCLQCWKFTFVAEDGSFVESSFIGEACDMGDKAFNKTSSIALKYVLLQMFLIPTVEQAQSDPDNFSYETTGIEKPLEQMSAKELERKAESFASAADFKAARETLENWHGKQLPLDLHNALLAGWKSFELRTGVKA